MLPGETRLRRLCRGFLRSIVVERGHLCLVSTRPAHEAHALDNVHEARVERQRERNARENLAEANEKDHPSLVGVVHRREVRPRDQQGTQRHHLHEGLLLARLVSGHDDAAAQEEGAHRSDAQLAHGDENRQPPGQEALVGQQTEAAQRQGLVCDGVGDAAKVGDLPPRARELPIEAVRDRGESEDDECRPQRAPRLLKAENNEGRNEDQAQNGQRVG